MSHAIAVQSYGNTTSLRAIMGSFVALVTVLLSFLDGTTFISYILFDMIRHHMRQRRGILCPGECRDTKFPSLASRDGHGLAQLKP
jgi:hypothetical protein